MALRLHFLLALFLATFSSGYADQNPEQDIAGPTTTWTASSVIPVRVDDSKFSKDLFRSGLDGDLDFGTTAEEFVDGFWNWAEKSESYWKENQIQDIQVVSDQYGMEFSKQQKAELQLIGRAHGVKVKFRGTKVTYEGDEPTLDAAARELVLKEKVENENPDVARRYTTKQVEELVRQVQQRVDSGEIKFGDIANQVTSEIERTLSPFFDEQSVPAEARTRILRLVRTRVLGLKASLSERIKMFFSELYERPDALAVAGGLTKASIAMTMSLIGYMSSKDISMHSWLVWTVLCRNALFEATIWGPFQQTYMNFVNRYIIGKFGDIASPIWGQILGFSLYGSDVALLHFSNPEKIRAPWDPVFLGQYFGAGTISGIFGGFFMPGVLQLKAKGYISGTQAQLMSQASDLIFPLEGALMAISSGLLYPVIASQNGIKFALYLVSKNLPARGVQTLMPTRMTAKDAVRRMYLIDEFIHQHALSDPRVLHQYLQDSKVPAKMKIAILKFAVQYAKSKQRLGIEPGPNSIALFEEYRRFLADRGYGAQLKADIDAAYAQHKAINLEKSTPREWWARANRKYMIKREVSQKIEEYTALHEIARNVREGLQASGQNVPVELSALAEQLPPAKLDVVSQIKRQARLTICEVLLRGSDSAE